MFVMIPEFRKIYNGLTDEAKEWFDNFDDDEKAEYQSLYYDIPVENAIKAINEEVTFNKKADRISKYYIEQAREDW